MSRVVLFVVASSTTLGLVAVVGCAAPVPNVRAADATVVGPPPAPSLYERHAPLPSPSPPTTPATTPSPPTSTSHVGERR
jgi:hypothetical protein